MSRRTIFRRYSAILLCGAAICGKATGFAEEGRSNVFDSIQQQVQSVFQKCRGAVVRIEATDGHGHLSGTGFFIDPNGTLFTSWTIGGDESRDVVVCHGDAKYPARRLVADYRAGVALLKVEAETPFLPLGSSRSLTIGSPVMTIGYPMDLPLTPSFGMIGGFDLKYLGRYFATTHIRANVAVQRGEGGAPLLSMNGEAVGILISSLDQGSASFVLPIEAAEKVRRDYVRFGEVRPGWIGVAIGKADAPVAGSVAVVQELIPGAPAEKAGLQAGDVLLQVGAKTITGPDDVFDASFYMTADDELPVRVARAGEQRELKVHPVESPQEMRRKIFPALGSTPLPPGGSSLKIGQ